MKTRKMVSVLLLFVMLLAMMPVSAFANAAPAEAAPTSITVQHNAENVIDGRVIVAKGDTFKLTAYDQNGEETPVVWENTSWGGGGVSLDAATGDIEVISDVYSGSTSYLYFKATSVLDETVSKQITVQATGYKLSEYQKNQTVALSEDGQTAKTATLTAGHNGHNIWSFDIPEGVATFSEDPGNKNSVKLNALRPGTFTATFRLDINEALTDTATFTVTGVALEDGEGNSGKTYLSQSRDNENPTKQLYAFVSEGRSISRWESADSTIATVDENGLVTACGVGSTIITATDSEGTKGGIKVVVESEDVPYFESLEFATTAFVSGTWTAGTTFAPTKLSYDLPIKGYSVSSLTLQKTTLYDTEKYRAVAEYTDAEGEKQTITVNSGAMTTLPKQPFGSSVMTITLWDKQDEENKTVYTFHVSRPRDTTKAIKRSGISLMPAGRALSATAYNGVAEGTMQKADENGMLTSGTGVDAQTRYYRTFLYDDAQSFTLNLAASTSYAHIRYSTDGGTSWQETAQGGGATQAIPLAEDAATEILIQVVDDAAYHANLAAEQDGFFETEPAEYKLWVDRLTADAPEMLTAEVSGGDWYPTFSPDMFSYWLVTAHDGVAPVLRYTVSEGSTVKIGTALQTPDENGVYTLTLGTSQKSISVASADGSFINTYKFGYKKKSALAVPDRVVDYLCMGSQYTNGGYGSFPEQTLGGSMKSLGNFGGYITYYYEEPITNNPNNTYGMDFYVIGNSMETNIDSMAELGQVYVSEDGNTWYALAGSEHYEEKALWDYTITYTKGDDGKAYWTDNYGNSIDYAAKNWPSASIYPLNDVAKEDSYSFAGVVFESQLGSIMGNSSSTGSFASSAKFGYADYYASNISGTTLSEVNPYVENPSKANGFDVAWAVDENGLPIDVTEKEFHYIKVATASNIFAGTFGEKSTEVTYVVRTTAQAEAVGKTAAPQGITISDGASSKTVHFIPEQRVYSVDLDDMKYVSVTVNGADAADNIYINNQRVSAGTCAKGFKVTKEKGETLVRVLVQNGDKEPVIYLVRLTSDATESDEIIEKIKISAGGSVREATTVSGTEYAVTVGHRVSDIAINPVIAPTASYTVDGSAPAESYALSYGSNTFTIVATDENGETRTAVLTVTREKAPVSSGREITVYFTLYGDENHGDSAVHTYIKNKKTLPVWIAKKAYTLPSESTVLDVFEMALREADLTWENDGGNYISEINGLAEFDNGAFSGWMYLIGGKHSDLGVAEQALKNGNNIIFHYTDDYTKEESAKGITATASGGGARHYTANSDANGNTIAAAVENTAAYVYQTVSRPQVGSVGGEWAVLGLARSGEEIPQAYYETYYKTVEAYVQERGGILHERKYTEYARVVLALTAIGKNPCDVGGYNLVTPLLDYEKTLRQGLNGPVWALIALDSGNYADSAIREKYMQRILESELPGGGFALSQGESEPDVDITAMALAALAKYKEREAVAAAIERGLGRLSAMQNDDGGFTNAGAANAESAAQVLTALSSLGISYKDSRFVKNGHTVVDNLLSYAVSGQGFSHTKNAASNLMATEQALYALVSLERFESGKKALFDMSDRPGAVTVHPERSFSCAVQYVVQLAAEELASWALSVK